MTIDESDPPTALDKATDAVRGATAAVQATSESIAGAIEAGRRPGGLLDQLARFTREAPYAHLLSLLCSVSCLRAGGSLRCAPGE
jgi:hypothetical protein